MAKQDVVKKIALALNKIRPMLERDGGDIDFVDFDEKTGVLTVRLQGHCAACPMAQVTLKEGIERVVKREVPEVKAVISI
ncbi:MAG: NifU family protein [Patescibacteria group bacterium]